jgi:hypothetical protein
MRFQSSKEQLMLGISPTQKSTTNKSLDAEVNKELADTNKTFAGLES